MGCTLLPVAQALVTVLIFRNLAAPILEIPVRREAMAKAVIVCDGVERLEECRQVLQQPVLACDCEGVDLGRQGSITLVQIATPEVCVLFDVVNESAARPSALVAALKEILEDEQRLKIVHDCKMDSDALHHHLGIRLAHVHDTAAWQAQLGGSRSKMSLNQALESYSLPINPSRDCKVYDKNPNFWADRPLTAEMQAWASSDVASLFALHAAQVARAGAGAGGGRLVAACRRASEEALRHRDLLVERVLLNPDKTGRFIGTKGANVNRIERETGAKFYTSRQEKGLLLVYSKSKEALKRALKATAPYTE